MSALSPSPSTQLVCREPLKVVESIAPLTVASSHGIGYPRWWTHPVPPRVLRIASAMCCCYHYEPKKIHDRLPRHYGKSCGTPMGEPMSYVACCLNARPFPLRVLRGSSTVDRGHNGTPGSSYRDASVRINSALAKMERRSGISPL